MKTTSILSTLCFLFFCTCMIQAQVVQPSFEDLKQIIEENSANRGDRGGDSGGSQQGSGGGAGGGENNFALGINIDWADMSKMMAQPSRISWQTFEGTNDGPYQIVVKGDKRILYVHYTSEHSHEVPLDKLGLKEGMEYSISISSQGKKISSKNAKFKIASKSNYYEAINTAKMESDFQGAKRINKILMKAWALQSNGFNYDAYKKYKMYVESDKDNTVLRNMRDMFRKEVKISCLCN